MTSVRQCTNRNKTFLANCHLWAEVKRLTEVVLCCRNMEMSGFPRRFGLATAH